MDPRTEKMLADRARQTEAIPKPLRGAVLATRDARSWAKAHKTQAIALSVIAVLTLSIGYYFLLVVPAAERDRPALTDRSAERLKVETVSKHANIEACLEKAKTDAEAVWAAACRAKKLKAGCALPREIVQEQQRRESLARNACLVGSN